MLCGGVVMYGGVVGCDVCVEVLWDVLNMWGVVVCVGVVGCNVFMWGVFWGMIVWLCCGV